jgi:hypothetical protein
MFNFLPHSLFTNHWGANSSGLSPRLWGKVSGTMMESDGSRRLFLAGDDFAAVHHAGTLTDLIGAMPYVIFSDDTTNHTVVGAADENCGVLQLNIDAGAGANEEIGVCAGDGTQQLGQISDTAGAAYMTAFEARFKVNNITNGKAGVFVGLAQPGIVANGGIIDTDGGPMANKAAIGFNILADDGDSLDFCYQGASQTRQDKIAGIKAPVVDTYIKAGFLYVPSAPAAKRIRVYVDNVENETCVTAANIAAATFPDAEALTFAALMKGIAGSVALELSIDWWAFAQVID